MAFTVKFQRNLIIFKPHETSKHQTRMHCTHMCSSQIYDVSGNGVHLWRKSQNKTNRVPLVSDGKQYTSSDFCTSLIPDVNAPNSIELIRGSLIMQVSFYIYVDTCDRRELETWSFDFRTKNPLLGLKIEVVSYLAAMVYSKSKNLFIL